MSTDFFERIDRMNVVFKINDHETPTFDPKRLESFVKVLCEETDEFLTVISDYRSELARASFSCNDVSREASLAALVEMADCLADHVVYCCSEARRNGFSLLPILQLVMDSQDSKLVDGQPIHNDERTKFIKGPFYQAPEKLIEKHFRHLLSCETSDEQINQELRDIAPDNNRELE